MRLKKGKAKRKDYNRKEMFLDNGPSYKQLLFKIAFIELNKIIQNTLKHLTMCDCVDRFKDQSITDV
jgi:hypothetical protein